MAMFLDFVQANPKVSVILMGIAVAFFTSLVNHFVMDKERMLEIKKRQKELQKEMKEHQKAGNHAKAMELQKEMMTYVGETFKHSFKPMLITIIPILVFFAFIKGVYATTAIASSWLWWYILGAFAGSLVFRKLFKLP